MPTGVLTYIPFAGATLPTTDIQGDALTYRAGVTTGTDALRGTVAVFDGTVSNQGITISNAKLTTSYTKMAWVYVTATHSRVQNFIGSSILSSAGTQLAGTHTLGLGASSVLIASHNGVSSVTLADSITLPMSQWVHVACTYDNPATRLTLYINAQQRSTTTNAGLAWSGSSYDTALGSAAVDVATGFSGSIDEIYVLSTALSQPDLFTWYMANRILPPLAPSIPAAPGVWMRWTGTAGLTSGSTVSSAGASTAAVGATLMGTTSYTTTTAAFEFGDAGWLSLDPFSLVAPFTIAWWGRLDSNAVFGPTAAAYTWFSFGCGNYAACPFLETTVNYDPVSNLGATTAPTYIFFNDNNFANPADSNCT